jgi:hypothetical protein
MNGGNDMKNTELKSKVMALGDRLSSRMGRRAWATAPLLYGPGPICKAGGLELSIKGVSFGSRQEALRRLAGYSPEQVRAFVVPEPENAAVMVGVQNWRGLYCLGYLPAEYASAATSLKATALCVIGDDVRGARLALTA